MVQSGADASVDVGLVCEHRLLLIFRCEKYGFQESVQRQDREIQDVENDVGRKIFPIQHYSGACSRR